MENIDAQSYIFYSVASNQIVKTVYKIQFILILYRKEFFVSFFSNLFFFFETKIENVQGENNTAAHD